VPWSRDICSTQRSPAIECERTVPQIETPICTRHTSHQFIGQQQHTCGAVGGSPLECGVGRQIPQDSTFSSPTPALTPRNDPSQEEPELTPHWCRTFPLLLVQRGMASSAACECGADACECGADEQTVDHVVLQCPIYRPPHGVHGLTVLDDETTEWLLNICPEI